MGIIKKRKESGITIRQEAIAELGKREVSQILELTLEFILVTVFMLTMTWCLVTGLNLEVLPERFTIGVIGSVVVFYGLFHLRKYLAILLPASALIFVISLFQMRPQIEEGFHFVANRFIELFNVYYEADLIKFLVYEGHETESSTIFLLFVAFFMVGLFSLFRWVRHRPVLSILYTVPMLILPLVVGELPNAVCLAGYIILSVALIGGGALSTDRRDYWVHMKVTIMIVAAGIGLFYTTYLIFTPKDYQDKIQIEEVKTTMQTALTNFSKDDFFDDTLLEELLPFGDGVATGGLSGGKLGRAEKIVFSNQTALVVTVPNKVGDKLYLRGYIGSSYTGDFWGQLSKEDKQQYDSLMKDFEEQNLSPETIGLLGLADTDKANTTLKIKVENVNAGKKSNFLPYVTKNQMVISKKGRVQLSGEKGNKTYSMEYYPYFNQDISKFIGLEDYTQPVQDSNVLKLTKDYESFAYQVYTKLPENGLKAAKVFQNDKFKEGENDFYHVLERVLWVRDYLSSGTSYSLSPGMLPQGKDFVDYFLLENKKGYCTHYASAATVLFRSMGIPARYVEGYVISSYDKRKGSLSKKNNTITMNLKDSNAHAWVEVYIKELGWIPIEVTPGYTQGNQIPQEILNQIKNRKEYLGNTTPLATIKPVNLAPTPPALVSKQTGKGNGLTLVDENEPFSYFVRVLQMAAGVGSVFLMVAVATLLRRKYWKHKRNKILQGGNNRKIISFYYKEMVKLLGQYGLYYKGEDYKEYAKRVEHHLTFLESGHFESGFFIVLEAGFSNMAIGKEKTKEVIVLYDAIYKGIYKSASKKQRIFLVIFGTIA